ncbi:copper chaperone PCu(A)C [Pseudolabrys taiwanensis]|uniref:Copper chaperone PCu(A)C n=1 Tax=Pseudolabrys taiwanensis TaxID=331696 RepID=A0A345ZR07_9HYPH|nr:copper chaperone PCu(A)C [Pseudolabrys taiwanensis]AXK79354.1 copper chaperone PCu(A)C [Pseudolabrys taiwanensis]
MKPTAFFLAAALAAFTTATAAAQDVSVGNIKIVAPWARATPKGASVGGAYFKITNTGTAPDRLVSGSSDVAQRVEIHEMSMDKGVMKMRELPKGLELKPGETVEFKPGGYHVMLVGLKKPLTQGEDVKATFQFEKAGKVDVIFKIGSIGAQSADGGGHDMGGMKMQHSH